ncbi:transcriptional regulator [Paenibacillus kribbensis]|uniref:Transcriptional regulator n=1 Tax=Paenibacillus kribbensis TaxID=172713 RepID=A0A222WQ66_9BACL|nr:ROK family protein [Paenibacillus kribbensis]ASR48072.1 transcriptional regulator [Paenibacillus kribbensis]
MADIFVHKQHRDEPKVSGWAAGIDVGGTKTLICIGTAERQVVLRHKFPTVHTKDVHFFFERLFWELENCLEQTGLSLEQLKGIGIGFPGMVDNDSGTITHAPAIQWSSADSTHVNIRSIIAQRYSGCLVLDNDVNMAALGEQWLGAARGLRHVMMVTVGTGIGSGLILNGELYKGAAGGAGEMAYWIAGEEQARQAAKQKGTDEFGVFESLTSGTAITRSVKSALASGMPGAHMIRLAEGDRDKVGARHVLQAAAEGDIEAQTIVEPALAHMAMALTNVISLLNPEMIVIGGGVAEGNTYYLDEIRQRVALWTDIPCTIVPAELGNEAGAIGGLATILGSAVR